jgi:undecaprenyl-diphosphatase
MDIFDAVFLGIIQGLTEFLPISSSGHLVIFQKLLGFQQQQLLFDCALHVGTLLAVVIYFSKDIKRIFKSVLSKKENTDSFLLKDIITGSIPTAIIGFLFKDYFERAFSSALIAGIMLCVTGLFVGATKFIPEGSKKRVGLITSVLIGIAQGIAIIPGISRSGATIVCGLMCKIDRELAFKFSFLLSIPAISGAFILEAVKINQIKNVIPLSLGTISSAIVGLIALRFLNNLIKKGNLYYFSPYCFAIGISTIVYCLL